VPSGATPEPISGGIALLAVPQPAEEDGFFPKEFQPREHQLPETAQEVLKKAPGKPIGSSVAATGLMRDIPHHLRVPAAAGQINPTFMSANDQP
jgi:hypothetical protein